MRRFVFIIAALAAYVSVWGSPVRSALGQQHLRMAHGDDIPKYDSIVEYVESVIPAYIDTGIRQSDTVIVLCDGNWMSNAADLSTMIGGGGDFYGCFRKRNSYVQLSVRVPKDDAPRSGNWMEFVLKPVDRHVYQFGFGGLYLDGNFYSAAQTWTGTTTTTIKIAGYNTGNTSRQGRCRYYNVRIWQGSDLVRDFVPVRIGEVGYMYDAVGGEVFGNAATSGYFLPGPDVTEGEE